MTSKSPKSLEMHSFFVVSKKDDSGIDPRIVSYHDEGSPIAEEYKILRTNIKSHFMRINRKKARKSADKKTKITPKILTVTSSISGEGKSISSTNLAITLARDLGSHVLVVDCDLRGGTQHHLLNVKADKGISEYLQGEASLESIMRTTAMPHMDLIPRGGIASNPSELLGSQTMVDLLEKLKDFPFSYIVLDTPPVLSYTDAGVLAEQSDGVIYVVQAFKTPKNIVKKSKEQLESADAKIIGFMLTQTDYFVSQYYGYHSYYYYQNKNKA